MNNKSVSDRSGAGGVTYGTYATGFVLSLVFTALAFGSVMCGMLPHAAALYLVLSAAVLQIMVQLRYFLHLDASSEMHWNVLALVITVLIMGLFVVGSIWIMYHLRMNMM